MHLQKAAKAIFDQLTDSIMQLSDDQYIQPCGRLLNNTIGQHVRHIIELFQCLEIGYDEGQVNYDKRKRDPDIETNRELACIHLNNIMGNISRKNRNLMLLTNFDEHSDQHIAIDTNYYREVAYNLEHSVHHMALIRVGIAEISKVVLPENYGMATSTLKHRSQCAQ